MTSEECKITTVELQENGIIRNDQGIIIGRLITTELLDELKSNTKELMVIDKRLKMLQEMTDVQGWGGNWNCDPYMHGLLNGMIFAESIMDAKEPKFRDAPKRWLDAGHRICRPLIRFINKSESLYNRYFGEKPISETVRIGRMNK